MTTKPFFIVQPASPRGYELRNIGAPQSYITGPNQTCHWYKLKRDAVKAAAEINKANR